MEELDFRTTQGMMSLFLEAARVSLSFSSVGPSPLDISVRLGISFDTLVLCPQCWVRSPVNGYRLSVIGVKILVNQYCFVKPSVRMRSSQTYP
jgi:hypothetical protein